MRDVCQSVLTFQSAATTAARKMAAGSPVNSVCLFGFGMIRAAVCVDAMIVTIRTRVSTVLFVSVTPAFARLGRRSSVTISVMIRSVFVMIRMM